MTPRARSPHMNNEEPIKLSHYPDGTAPDIENGDNVQEGEVQKRRRKLPIERDDFPAPPFPYSSSKRGKLIFRCMIHAMILIEHIDLIYL